MRCPLLATCFVSVFVAGCQEKTFVEAIEPPTVSRTSIRKLTCLDPARLLPPWQVLPEPDGATRPGTLRFRAQPKYLGSTWNGDPADPDQGYVTVAVFPRELDAVTRSLPPELIAKHIASGLFQPIEIEWIPSASAVRLEAYDQAGAGFYYTPDRKVQCRELARSAPEAWPNPFIECQIDTAPGARARMILSSYNRPSLPTLIAHAINAVEAVADCSNP